MLAEPEIRRAPTRVGALLRELRDPLFRNGHMLILSSLATSAIGMLFWVLAARNYPAATLGRNAVALSTMTYLGGVAQLNLTSALVRFIPAAGPKVRRFVASTYAVSLAVAVVLALGFALLIPTIAPSLRFISSNPVLITWWILATATWAVFVLEDGALVGLRRSPWVPVENAGFSVLKAGLVVPFASLFAGDGIFLAWTVATLATVIPTNTFLFGKAIPRAQRESPVGDVHLGELIRFVPYDYLASLAWLGATLLLPLLIIRRVGAADTAYFNLAWVIAYCFYLVSINIGLSLVVESAVDQSDLDRQSRRVLSHVAKLLVPGVAVVVVGAPLILGLFGHAYAVHGVTTLRLLVLSALPFIVTSTAISALRGQRKTRTVFVIDAAICVFVISLTVVLLPHLGIAAAGYAWLITQLVVAGAIIAGYAFARLGARRRLGAGPLRVALVLWLARFAVRLALPRPANPVHLRRERRRAGELVSRLLPDLMNEVPLRDAPSHHVADIHVVPSESDLTVVLLRNPARAPLAVVKIARSEQAAGDLVEQRRILAALADDARLGAWHELLPAYALRERESIVFAIEPPLPGIETRHLLDKAPWLARAVAERGMEAIASLHRRTRVSGVFDEALLAELVGRPARALASTHPTGAVPDVQRRALDRLERELGARGGETLDLAWTHGDYTPGNVMFAPDAARVTAVLDWGQARPDGIPVLDALAWVSALYCRERRQQLGQLVCETIALGRLPDDATLALAGPALEATPMTAPTAMTWMWLTHVAGNLGKSGRYARRPLWWTSNVEPVFEAIVR